jgi:hypothetical protein
MYNPRPSDLDTFTEEDLKLKKFSHEPTDYFRNTVMEPSVNNHLRPSFGEYDSLGKKHTDLSDRIEALNEKMKFSRQRGAFQALQDQMKEVKNLVKEREKIDAQMATIDLARKKTDDHRIATGEEVSYSERIDSVSDRIANLEKWMTTGKG